MSIKLEGINYLYGQGTEMVSHALKNINIEIKDGEFVGLIGHTGSGKSTLVQHLNGLIRPTEGHIYLDGQDIYAEGYDMKKHRSNVGLVFQYPEHQLFEVDVLSDVCFGPKNLGLKKAEVEELAKKALALVGMGESYYRRSPFDLSGGQKRRVAIAGVIAMEPEILILDEPTAGLDPEGREDILSNIQRYRQAKNATIMMVSHSMSDVARLAERLLVMNESRLVMDGTPAEVFSRAEELLEMGLDIPEVTRVFLKLQQMGMAVKQVYTLEQAVAELQRVKGGNGHA